MIPCRPEEAESLRRPVGLFAAAAAAAIAIASLFAMQAYALRLAAGQVHRLAAAQVPVKYEDLTLQRAALAAGDLLPIYGSSELFCCGAPDIGTQFFAHEPTGFEPFAVGRAGTGDLFFLETFGALGRGLRGRKVVISDSPPWFFGPQGITAGYDGNFSPEVAEMFVYDAPLPLSLKEAAAPLMLRHPKSLKASPLLRLGLRQLADPTPLHLALYYALLPAGRLDAWALQLKDAWQTIRFIRAGDRMPGATATGSATVRTEASPRRSAAASRAALGRLTAAAAGPARGPIAWTAKLAAATRLAEARGRGNPFGFPPGHAKVIAPALRMYCGGRTNRSGQVYGYPGRWVGTMTHSAEWSDLRLELAALADLHAGALVWSVPMPGVYDDFTRLSQPARQAYYARFEAVAGQSGFPAIDFAAQDEAHFELTDPGAHFSPRGWVLADRALDLFWHGQAGAIPGAIAQLTRAVPVPGPQRPAAPGTCTTPQGRHGRATG